MEQQVVEWIIIQGPLIYFGLWQLNKSWLSCFQSVVSFEEMYFFSETKEDYLGLQSNIVKNPQDYAVIIKHIFLLGHFHQD